MDIVEGAMRWDDDDDDLGCDFGVELQVRVSAVACC